MGRNEFERVSPESVGIRSRDIEWLLDRLEEDHTQMHGLMIMRDGKVCAEGWWSPYAPGLRHGLQSLSKTYAATAVGIAYTEGLLDLNTRVIDIFKEEAPEHPGEYLSQLKVRDVLCMGCGMDEMPVPGKDWVRQFLATPVMHVPGTTFMYNSLGSSLLGEMVKKLTGQGLQEYLTPRLFDVIGIDAGNLRWLLHPDGMEVGGGGLYATTEDNLRLMKLYLDGGVWEGRRILAEDYVRLATSLRNDSASEQKVNPPATDNFLGYGFQIWMCKYPGAYRADGAMGQFSICLPDLDMIIAVNETAIAAEGIQITLDYIWEFVRKLDPAVKSLPADPEAERHLSYRMDHLAVANPKYTPYHRELERYNDRVYKTVRLEDGSAPGFETQIMQDLMGDEGSAGMDTFSFRFEPGHTRMYFSQDGISQELSIATDGTRQQNCLQIRGEVARIALASGQFLAADTFAVTVLWPETCYTKTLTFRLSGDGAEISAETFPFTTTIPGGTSKMMEAGRFTAKVLTT